MNKKSIGILNQGRDNTFVNNKVDGFDTAAQDSGTRSFWKNNDLKGKNRKRWFGIWWGQLILGLVIVVVGGVLLSLIIK